MKTLLLLSLLLSLLIPFQSNEGSPLSVTSFKWSHSRYTPQTPEVEGNAPQRAMIPQNRNFSRNARINDQRGARDPNQDTIDGRSEAMEKSVQESRAPKSDPLEGFAYRIKVKNSAAKVVEIVFWEYQFQEAENTNTLARRQFLCGVNIRPDKEANLEGFSLSGPSDVVSVGALADKSRFKENVVINRIEFADGSIWQRKGWHLAEVKGTYERVLREPWVPGQCKGL